MQEAIVNHAPHITKPLCVKWMFLGAFEFAAGVVARLVVALWSGFGSDRSKELAVQDVGWPRGTHETFLIVLPDPAFYVCDASSLSCR